MKCWVCGKPNAEYTRHITAEYNLYDNITIRDAVKEEHQRCYCEKCFKAVTANLKEENKQFTLLKRRRLYERALDSMERQKIDFYEYEDAIKTIGEYNEENDGKFDSSYEIMAAIVLIQNHYHIKPQAKIQRYQVDFMLPDDKLILEIDGERHNSKKGYDSVRDEKIRNELGKDWEIIRIPTELIDQNVTKLPKAIEKVLDYRDTKKINWRSL